MKKFACILLSACILFSLASCSKTDEIVTPASNESVDDHSSQGEEGKTELPITAPEPKELLFEYDDTEDVSEPLEHFADLNGNYVSLSRNAEENAITQWPRGMYDVENGVVVVYAVDEFDNSTVQIQHINVETGKQTYMLTAEIRGTFKYIRDIRDDQRYSDGGDILIVTSLGAYAFDFDNISERPKSVEIDDILNYSVGQLSLQDQSGQTYSLSNERFDVYVPDKKLVYSIDDGVFVSDIDGKNEKKILEQPQPEEWFANTDLVDVPGKANAVYAAPQFMSNGSKVVCEIKNFDILNETVGFVVIDIESGQSTRVNFYDSNDIFYKAADWTDLYDPKFVSIDYVDETTLDIYFTATSSGRGSLVRLDCIYDLVEGKISYTKINNTGITSDYVNMVYNETYKGETGKVCFGSFMGETEYTEGIKLSGATTSAVAISEDYSLVIVTNNDRTKSFRILATVVKG